MREPVCNRSLNVSYTKRNKLKLQNKRNGLQTRSCDGIPPYLEIEAKSVVKVEMMIEKLGFDRSQATSIGVRKVYKKYGIDIYSIKELKFE